MLEPQKWKKNLLLPRKIKAEAATATAAGKKVTNNKRNKKNLEELENIYTTQFFITQRKLKKKKDKKKLFFFLAEKKYSPKTNQTKLNGCSSVAAVSYREWERERAVVFKI